MNRLLCALKGLSKTDIAAISLIGFSFILIFIRAFSDGTLSDEAFYVTIPLRIINGDGLFTDEWHLSQLSSVLLYLPVKLFTTLTGGTEGIILYMRLLFCLMQLGTSILIYTTLRSYSIAAIIISFSFIHSFMIGINTLSYNTIGLACLFALICIMYRGLTAPSALKMLLSGSLIAAFILCQPFGVVFYLAYFIAVCVFIVRNSKTPEKTPFPFTVKSFFMTVAGILPVLIFFLYLLLKNSDIETIISCIPGILSDLEHMVLSENLGIKTFSLFVFFKNMTMCAGLIPLIIFVISLIAAIVLKKKNRNIAFITAAVGFGIITAVFWFRLAFMIDTTETDDINFFYLPLALAGIAFYILTEKRNMPVFILFWCSGITYALLMTASSNMGLHASINGYIVSAAGSLILATDAHRELLNESDKDKDKIKKLSAVILAGIVFGLSIFNTTANFSGPMISRLTIKSSKMSEGVYKGITLPTEQAVIYTRVLRDAQEMKEILLPEDKLFVLDNIPAAYLEGNFNMGTFSGWFICEQLQVAEVRDRFRNYYDIFPENIPDYVYVPSYRYGQDGPSYVRPKIRAEYAYKLFDGETIELYDGLLIKVTGIKDE